MLKNILNLEGIQKLSRNEQKAILGAETPCGPSCKKVGVCQDGKCVYLVISVPDNINF